VHRYSASRGIGHLRSAITKWYKKKYGVTLDPETEAIVTIGSKEGLCHLALAMLNRGDLVMVPNPTYPSHIYSVVIAGGTCFSMPLTEANNFLPDFTRIPQEISRKAKVLVVSYPHNPTTGVAGIEFFKEVVDFCSKRDIIVIHDLAYAEICFDGYAAPSFLEVEGAKDIGIEFYSLSKSYSMAGWRVGFACGNRNVIGALAKLKSYYDYGMFTAIQVASIVALEGPQECVKDTVSIYQKRRDIFVKGLNSLGWEVPTPSATMYVWAKIPDRFQMGSMEFASFLLKDAKVAVSPGIGFGEHGEGYVRFALVENEKRIRQAVKGIKDAFKKI
jgi:alanine-synthesizing transaminase